MNRKDVVFPSLQEAADIYFIQIVHDYFGSSIRDYSKESQIQLGKDIDEHGVDSNGNIDYLI
jgi:hypothetical protein